MTNDEAEIWVFMFHSQTGIISDTLLHQMSVILFVRPRCHNNKISATELRRMASVHLSVFYLTFM